MATEATGEMRAEDVSDERAGQPAGRIVWRSVLRELAWASGAALGALLIAVLVYDLWHYPMRIPLGRDGDGLAAQTIIRSVLDHGWVGHNPDIGAPYGSSLYDSIVSLGDATQLGLAKLLGLFTSDAAVVMNALFLLGFPLAALTSYPVLRDLRFDPLLATGGAILFATTNYHFARGTGHYFLGLAYAVPLACWLLFGVFGLVRLTAQRPGRDGLTSWITLRSAVTVVAALIVGTSEIYYSVFALALLAMLGPLVALARRSWKPLLVSGVLCLTIGAGSIAAQLPQLRYQSSEGSNPVSTRLPSESETYSLKLLDLIVPVAGHRVHAFDAIGSRYRENTLLANEGAFSGSLGTFATIGLLGAWLIMLVAILRGRTPPDARLLMSTGLLAGLAFGVATLGGLGAVVAFYVSPQIRAWNRISVVIAFLSIIAALWFVQWMVMRAKRRGIAAPAISVAIIALFALAVLDQAPSRATAAYVGLESWRSDYRFVRNIEATLPEGGAILQLPYMAFPENGPINGMLDYQHLRLYVLGKRDLRWSYGASRNRLPEDWGAAVSESLDTAALAKAAAIAGFSGIAIDRSAYADGGDAVSARLRSTAGEPLVSEDGNREFFDLRGLASELEAAIPDGPRADARRELLDGGPVASFDPAAFYPEESDGSSTWRWTKTPATITVSNPGAKPVSQILTTRIATPGSGSTVTIQHPDGARRVATRNARATPVRQRITFPPGQSTITFSTDAPDENADPRDLRIKLIDFTLTDPALSRALSPR